VRELLVDTDGSRALLRDRGQRHRHGRCGGLSIGHLSDTGAPQAPFQGKLDSVQLYDRPLTGTELCAIIGEPGSCLPCDGALCN
jgi:hypothetical protein